MRKPSIRIRMGAAYHDATVDGTHFDLSTFSRADRHKFSRLIIGALTQCGFAKERVAR